MPSDKCLLLKKPKEMFLQASEDPKERQLLSKKIQEKEERFREWWNVSVQKPEMECYSERWVWSVKKVKISALVKMKAMCELS